MVEEAKKKGAFWGAVLAAMLPALLASGGVSYGVTQASEADILAQEEARDLVFQKYVDEHVVPAFEEALDEELGVLEEEIDACRSEAQEADKQAFAALEAVRMRFGSRTVSRALDEAEKSIAEEASKRPSGPLSMGPPKPKKKLKDRLPDFQKYQQQQQVQMELAE